MGDRENWIHPPVVDPATGALSYVSVSSMNLGDASADGCQRKWHYKYVEHIEEPSTEAQKRGVAGHAVIERYLKSGDTSRLTADVAPGMHMVQEPGADLLVEWDILRWPGRSYPDPLTKAHSPALLSAAPVKIAGVPLLGFIDVAHSRGTNKGCDDADEAYDPEGTVEVCDWKFVGSTRFLKSRSDLPKLTQLAAYATWVWVVRPQTPRIRISLGYFPRRGRARKVSTLVRREDIAPQMEHAAGVVRSIAHAAREVDSEQVDANTDVCDRFGGCFYRSRCTAPMRKTLASMVGQTMAAAIHIPSPFPDPQQGLIPVASLLQRQQAGVQTSVQVAPASTSPDPVAVAAEQVRIAAAERAAKFAQLVPPGFIEACAGVRAFGQGFPKLAGNAAIAYAASGGQDVAAGHEFSGTGDISYVTLAEPGQMAQLLNDLQAQAQARGVVVAVLPPDAPASDPALAAEYPQTPGAADAAADAPVQQVLPTTGAPPAPAPVAEPVTTKAKKKKEPATSSSSTAATGEVVDPAIHIYTDCASTRELRSLDGWAQDAADAIARAAGTFDIRCGNSDSDIAFGKWKGVLTALVRDPIKSPIPGGHYSISTTDEVRQVVAEALVLRARDSGGSYTRGLR